MIEIILLIYGTAVFITYSYLFIAYSKKGFMNDQYPDAMDMFIIICPALNFIGVYGWLFNWPYKKSFLEMLFKK